MLDKWAQKPVSSEERPPTNLYGRRSQNKLLRSCFHIRPGYHDSVKDSVRVALAIVTLTYTGNDRISG